MNKAINQQQLSLLDELPKMYHEKSHQLVTTEAIRNYCMGGRGVVTLYSPTKKSHTYSFRKPKEKDVFAPGTMFVYVLCERKEWKYVGMLTSHGNFRITKASYFSQCDPIFKGAEYIVKMIQGKITSTPMKLYHEGVCSVCGRKLTKPSSLDTGMGRRCWMNVTGYVPRKRSKNHTRSGESFRQPICSSPVHSAPC